MTQAVVDSASCACAACRGLRIADASVMPTITSGNTNSPTLMIAERAAELLMRPGLSHLPAPRRPAGPGRQTWRPHDPAATTNGVNP